MSALHDLTVAQLAAKLKAREVSAVEAAQHFLARSRQHADLGAYLAQDEAVTLAQAQAASAVRWASNVDQTEYSDQTSMASGSTMRRPRETWRVLLCR